MKKKIRIIASVAQQGDHKVPEYVMLDVEMISTRRYHNSLYKLGHISPCARSLIDFMCEQMNADNLVRNDRKLREAFSVFLVAGGLSVYSDKAIHKAVAELVDQRLLLRKHKGTLLVNPLHFFRGDERRRPQAIRSGLGIQLPNKPKKKP